MKAIPKIEKGGSRATTVLSILALEQWAKESEKQINDLKQGLETIFGLGNKTGESREQYLADIAKATLNKNP